MKSIQISTLSNKEFSYNILNAISVRGNVEKNDYHLPLDALFRMAARINKRRSFLFVSKVLGKHIPINPNKGLLTSALLAAKYYEEMHGVICENKEQWLKSFVLSEPTFHCNPFIPEAFNPLIIGFAETATALGHAFFDCFKGANYVHTTREVLVDKHPVIAFEEEHSHATSHRCYLPLYMIANDREIILVDDELTTGKTALNIIRSIHSRFPRKKYTVVSILDWRSEEHKRDFQVLEEALGISIGVVSLVAGSIQVEKLQEIDGSKEYKYESLGRSQEVEKVYLSSFFEETAFSSKLSNGSINRSPFIMETGRFGISSDSNLKNKQKIIEAAAFLASKKKGNHTLFLGTGEFMYLPMKLAAEMGRGISYQSTTRSPIFIQNRPQYGAAYGLSFLNPEDPEVSHYVYNIQPGLYDELFLFFERETENQNLIPLLKELEKTQINSIKLIYFSEKKE